MAGGVRKGEVQAEWGVEPGTAEDLSGYTHEAKGPSESHPAGPKAESHGAAASVQERSVSSCREECELVPRVRTSGLPTQPCGRRRGGLQTWGWVLLPKHKLLPRDICGQ